MCCLVEVCALQVFFLVYIILWDLYTNTTDSSFYPDKPNQMAERMDSPQEMLPFSPAVVPSPEVQKESTTGASPQEISVGKSPPASLTESQGQFNAHCYVRFIVNGNWKSARKPSSIILPLSDPDVESLLLDEEPKQVLHSPPKVQEAWEQENQQQM